MRKSADVVILMQPSSNYQLLYPTIIAWEEYQKYTPLSPFADEVVEYLNALSASLLKDRESRVYPDVITFAFFCRKANLLAQKRKIYIGGNIEVGSWNHFPHCTFKCTNQFRLFFSGRYVGW